ncbi:MAG: RDD family protein [Ornithinimicrobium sp.]
MAATGIMDTQGFVTPEAVELDLPAANIGLRICSGLIDLLITVALLFLGIWLVSGTAVVADVALLQALVTIALVGALVGIPITLETLLRGRTVGKLAMGLRTVRDDAGPIGFRHAVIRGLMMFVEVWLTLGVLAAVVSVANAKGKRLGDYLAGTYVVRDRIRLRLAPAPQSDPLLDSWVRGADISGLPDALTVAVRQILTRSSTMTPAAHAAMTMQLYSNVMEHVAPPPPMGAPPLAVMSTVLAERRRRDVLRTQRHDDVRSRVLGPDPLAPAPRLTPGAATPAPPRTPAG